MIFAGSSDRGYFAEEISVKRGMKFTYIDSMPSIQAQTNNIVNLGKQDFTIFDIEQYIDEPNIIADEIDKICKCNLSKPIIFAAGYLPTSNVIVELANRGIKYFVLASTLYEMKDQLEKCLNGFYDANGIEVVEEIQKSLESAVEQVNYNCTTIAVVGACNRIGTTTCAIQIVRYIQFCGKKACYIQMNSNNYISSMKTWYEVEEDEDIGKVTFQNVDHFYKPENIREILNMGYDFFVYDFGTFFDTDFNKVSFLEKDKQIFIVGSDQSEMNYTLDVIRSAFYDSVNYIFNFTDESEKEDVLELMKGKADKTFFSRYVPNKYVYVPNDIYNTIIPIAVEQTVEPKIKKKGLFKKVKK